MKILMVNKFLFPRGGAETYMFELGAQLEQMGHEVQYFGMEHEGRCVGNRLNLYTANIDFHGGSRLAKITYPFRIIYSAEARKKIRKVLDDFEPDIVHLNNFNYQLTPSILLEIDQWRKENGKACHILYTAHDYQLVCPAHLCYQGGTGQPCEECLQGNYIPCIRHRCIHGSMARSLIGCLESTVWHKNKVYDKLDTIICCSNFMKSKLDTEPVLRKKTVALHNFIQVTPQRAEEKQEYVLYFGRYSEEKGIETLLQAARQLPEIPFVFAGSGPLKELLQGIPNVKNVGFQSGEALRNLIAQARFSVCPSECYDNCPFSVMESMTYGTPVLGTKIGGIPELISDGINGELFRSGDVQDLTRRIRALWNDVAKREMYTRNCEKTRFDTVRTYAEKVLRLYEDAKIETVV